MRRGSVKFIVLLLTIMLSVGCSNMKLTSNPLSEAGMREIVVEKGDVIVRFTVNGVAEAATTRVRSTMSGIVSSVHVSLGDRVMVGDKLVQLDDWEQRVRLDAAQLKYTEALLRLEKAAVTYAAQVETEKNKVDSLAAQLKTQEMQYNAMLEVKEAYSRQELEIKRMAYESAIANHATALKAYETLLANKDYDRAEQLSLQAAQAEVVSAQRSLDRAQIVAPTEGQVAQFSLNAGDIVNANQEVAVISGDLVKRVNARILELDLPSVKVGQEVFVTFAALPEEQLAGRIVAIDILPASAGTDFASYKVTIDLIEGDDRVRSGMTCAVDFVLEQALDVVYAPSQAVIELDEKFYIQMKGADNVLGLRQVKKGLDDGRRVQILDGLIPGEKIMIKLPTK